MIFPYRALLILSLLLQSSGIYGQDSLNLRNEIGFALNRYLPDLENENRPFFFSLEFRTRWKETEKYQHFVTARVAGNYNKFIAFKPLSTKLYLAAEIGHWSRRKHENTKWHVSWGVSAGYYRFMESVTPLVNTNPYNAVLSEPYDRIHFRLGLSPKFGVEYEFNEKTYAQAVFAIGFGLKYMGDTEHLAFSGAGGFSAQFPSIGLYRKF